MTMQKIDVIVKLTFEADIAEDDNGMYDRVSTTVIAGCQSMANDLCKPVEIVEIMQEAEIYDLEGTWELMTNALKSASKSLTELDALGYSHDSTLIDRALKAAKLYGK